MLPEADFRYTTILHRPSPDLKLLLAALFPLFLALENHRVSNPWQHVESRERSDWKEVASACVFAHRLHTARLFVGLVDTSEGISWILFIYNNEAQSLFFTHVQVLRCNTIMKKPK